MSDYRARIADVQMTTYMIYINQLRIMIFQKYGKLWKYNLGWTATAKVGPRMGIPKIPK